MTEFSISLLDVEKTYLKDLVRLSIASHFGQGPVEPPAPPTKRLEEKYGAFVTLKLEGRLRGCIGNIMGTDKLYRTVWDMAQAAAFRDARFNPVTPGEADKLEIEISVLGPVELCPDLNEIKVGRHGLIMQRGGKSGLLLPQVPVEWGWNREQFLQHTCRKAGLPSDVWSKAGTTVYWFEAEVF